MMWAKIYFFKEIMFKKLIRLKTRYAKNILTSLITEILADIEEFEWSVLEVVLLVRQIACRDRGTRHQTNLQKTVLYKSGTVQLNILLCPKKLPSILWKINFNFTASSSPVSMKSGRFSGANWAPISGSHTPMLKSCNRFLTMRHITSCHENEPTPSILSTGSVFFSVFLFISLSCWIFFTIRDSFSS